MDGMDIDDPPPLPDNVLVEVRRFILGCSAKPVETSGVASLYSTEQSRLALHLLKTLPCARSAVLEYLCNVFNEAVKCHLGPKMTNRGSQPAQSPGYVDALNTIVSQTQEVLLDFVGKNPESWAPIISAWAIELLGQISSEYSQHCARSNASLQDLFQMYTACPASSALLEITSRCVSTLIASCPDLCVNELLNTAVRHAPAFDWVVAHIGSCFPKTIITRVLCVGRKDFCVFHASSGGSGVEGDCGPAAKMYAAKMNSVVGILNYLTSRGHKLDIRCAIHSQFQESLSPLEDDVVVDASSSSPSNSVDSATLQHATLPYLLHLASLSPVLLKIVAADIVASFSKPAVLRQLTEHLERWMNATASIVPQNSGGTAVEDRLLSLAVSLIIRIDDSNGALDVLKLLLHTADPDSFASKNDDDEDDDDNDVPFIPDIAKNAAFTILDHLTLQLQQRVYVSFKDRADVPFLIAIKTHWRPICEMLSPNSSSASSSSGQSRRRHLCSRLETTVVRLLTFISLQSESLSSAVLSTIILDSSTARDASLFFPILSGIQSLTPPVLVNVLHAVFEAVSARQEEFVAYRALTNVRYLLDIEKHNLSNTSPSDAGGLMPNASLKACLQKAECLTTMSKILSSFSSCRVLRVGIQLLLHLGLTNSSMSSSALLATGVAVNFFKLVAESSSSKTVSITFSSEEAVKKKLEYQKTLTLSSQFLAKTCQRSHSIRTVVLRALLEGCLSPEYSNLFSTTSDSQTVLTISDSSQIGGHSLTVSSDSVAPTASLRDDNYSLPTQRSGRTLPSGVIGDGLRQKDNNRAGSMKNNGRGLATDSSFTGIPDSTRKANRVLLLDVFYRCCSNQEIEDLSEISSSSESSAAKSTAAKSATNKKLPRLTPSKSATQNLSHLLVELVSPEVLHGGCLGGAWPDEDTVRQTVERDLVIKKRLQNHDVILDVIDLVAKGGAVALVPCLPIIRAWMASLIIFWDSNRDSNPSAASNTWYYGASLRLVKAMALGNLIPHPLSHSDELFQYAAPFERYLLLVNIWRFMKESPLPLDLDEDKLESRLREVDPKFIEVMRSVINANIARASPLFGFLFPASKKKTPTVTA